MGLRKKIIIVTVLAFLSGCATERYERYEQFQGDTIWLKPGEALVKSRHERNFEIWLKNQKDVTGITSFKSAGPCPDVMGH